MGKCGPAVKYVVRLDAEERQQLEGIITTFDSINTEPMLTTSINFRNNL